MTVRGCTGLPNHQVSKYEEWTEFSALTCNFCDVYSLEFCLHAIFSVPFFIFREVFFSTTICSCRHAAMLVALPDVVVDVINFMQVQ